MTSTSIYTPITPTYLYIKQHSITKKKYFGKTTKDPYTYNGSGVYWTNHIKKHGKEHIVTLWVSDLYYDTSIVEVALQFSADNDIVKSKEWANTEPENGLNGCPPGTKRSEEAKINMRKPRSEEAKINMRKSEETKAKMRRPRSEETKAKLKGRPSPNKDKPHTDEAKAKMSVTMTGKKRGPYKKHKPHKPHKHRGIKQITCPHCGKTGGENGMKRWHFDKCKTETSVSLFQH